MPPTPLFQSIAAHLRAATGAPLTDWKTRSLAGGCINAAAALTDTSTPTGRTWFVKTNTADTADMFAAEADALAVIAATDTIRVPAPICHGTSAGNHAYLVLEFIELTGPRSAQAESAMGAQLAALHRVTSANGKFGWHRDNTIGATPQPNPWSDDWPSFFAEHRLAHQFRLAADKGHTFSKAEALLDAVPSFFASHTPEPSLLHGDLWGGNAAFDATGAPVLFDPATYHGDRETDIAFTEMFGGFGPLFYESYHRNYPLDPGFPRRKDLYNLYHVLNHFNLFGGGYASQAEQIISGLV